MVVLVVLLGAIVGSLVGELIGLILPEGSVVKDFFLRTGDLALGPATLNAVIFSFTIGLELHINVIGIIGVIIAVYLLRWY